VRVPSLTQLGVSTDIATACQPVQGGAAEANTDAVSLRQWKCFVKDCRLLSGSESLDSQVVDQVFLVGASRSAPATEHRRWRRTGAISPPRPALPVQHVPPPRVLTEIYLCTVCACHEIWGRSGRGHGRRLTDTGWCAPVRSGRCSSEATHWCLRLTEA
jgi:hypothetical protein